MGIGAMTNAQKLPHEASWSARARLEYEYTHTALYGDEGLGETKESKGDFTCLFHFQVLHAMQEGPLVRHQEVSSLPLSGSCDTRDPIASPLLPP